MLPMRHDDLGKNRGFIGRWKEKLFSWVRLIISDPNSRNLLGFLLLNLTFAFVELFYGVWTNSLGLISDSFHMFFDCTGLMAGLVATVITKWKSNDKYSYGYVRAETLAGFINGLFLLFISFFIFSEAVERLVEPPEVKHERLLVVSILGFLVNLVGIFVFQHGGAMGGHGHSHGDEGHGHSHDGGHSHGGKKDGERSQIMQGVFLHILADTLGSVGVIISAILMQMFGWMIADPVCSIFIAVLIALSVGSLVADSVAILMQRSPKQLDQSLPDAYQKVMQLEGVQGVQETHFWTLCSNYYCGGLKLEVSADADAKYIVSHTQMIFRGINVTQLFVHLDFIEQGQQTYSNQVQNAGQNLLLQNPGGYGGYGGLGQSGGHGHAHDDHSGHGHSHDNHAYVR
eukprot:GFUD01024810.1.p1 GENE.GFUD01024810.1~~GFUD01024810.1.p1  ORF type:complete len:400 (-),score=74.68 GFUD01024810.1:1467-2666(-)